VLNARRLADAVGMYAAYAAYAPLWFGPVVAMFVVWGYLYGLPVDDATCVTVVVAAAELSDWTESAISMLLHSTAQHHPRRLDSAQSRSFTAAGEAHSLCGRLHLTHIHGCL
jgi:hypothetical protein